MKKVIAVVVALIFALGAVSFAFAYEKCDKCHKGDKALDKVAAAKKLTTAEDIKKAVMASPKAKMHEKFTDEDYQAAAKGLKK